MAGPLDWIPEFPMKSGSFRASYLPANFLNAPITLSSNANVRFRTLVNSPTPSPIIATTTGGNSSNPILALTNARSAASDIPSRRHRKDFNLFRNSFVFIFLYLYLYTARKPTPSSPLLIS